MAEIGTRTADPGVRAKISETINGIIAENRRPGGTEAYRGHACEFSPTVEAVRERVRKGIGTEPDRLLSPKPYWDPGFSVLLVENGAHHNYALANRIYADLRRHTSQGRPVIYITPVGPMGQYPVLADLLNTAGGVDTRLVFPFAMDEWSTADGGPVSSADYPYMSTFRDDMAEQFYSLLKGDARIPDGNLSFAAGDGLESYAPRLRELLDRGAAAIITGGVGKIGHIMFWEGTYGARLG